MSTKRNEVTPRTAIYLRIEKAENGYIVTDGEMDPGRYAAGNVKFYAALSFTGLMKSLRKILRDAFGEEFWR